MKLTRPRILIACCIGCVAAWLVVVGLERFLYPEEANYSLIEDHLYMGGYVAEPPPGTKAVLNLDQHVDPFSCDISLWKPIRDAAPAPSIAWLRDAVAFVDAQQKLGHTTYVHCMNGASRSGLVVVAYMMYKKQWTRDQALDYVRSKRPETRPNPAFMDRLLEWERVLFTENAFGGLFPLQREPLAIQYARVGVYLCWCATWFDADSIPPAATAITTCRLLELSSPQT